MPADVKLVALFAGLHLLGLILVCVLLVLFFRSDATSPWSPGDEDGDGGGGGGGNDRVRPRNPGGPRGGGIPLPDALPARVRLRDHRRLADLLPRPARRAAPEPARRPRRVPASH
jgi:hypothetical protein